MTRKAILFIFSCVLPLVLFTGCGENNQKTPDVSGVKVALQTYRFDVDMYDIDTNHVVNGLTKLRTKYPDFLDFFLDTVMGFGVHNNYSDTNMAIMQGVHEYLSHKDYRGLEDEIKKNFPDTKETDKEITDAFKLLKYYMPTSPVPKVIYINRILVGSSAFHVDLNTTCVCLDMFLGETFPIYESLQMPAYMAPHHDRKYIPVALFREIYEATYQYRQDEVTLLDRMLQRGKEQYFLHAIMPHTADSTLFGFRANQVQWCTKNEGNLYNFFVQQNLLYNKEERAIGTYVVDGPYAKNIGSATDEGNPTPGNVGSWVGYKIVAAYMAQHPQVTLKQLLEMQIDPTRFLEEAKYRPK